LWIKKGNVVGDAGWVNCSSFSNRTKEKAEGAAARHHVCFGSFDTQDGIPGLVGGK
jgi:hypothetical protein